MARQPSQSRQIPLQLPVASVIGKDGEVANARLINAYAEQIDRDGKAAYVLYGAPGLTRWDQGSYTGAERGMIQLNDSTLVAVLGNQVVKFDTSGKDTLIGAISGSGRVIMSRDRNLGANKGGTANYNDIAVTTSDGQYYLITGGDTVTKMAVANLPAPISVTYLAGHYLYCIPDGRVFCSDIDDGTTVNAAAFNTANSSPDNNVRAYAYNNYLYVFGKQTIEVWIPDPSLANQPFPYSTVNQVITLGLLAPYSIAELDEGLAFVDDSGIVRYAKGGSSSQRLSTHSVERAIQSLSPSDQALITGSVEKIEGHVTYTLSSPSWTWIYDSTTKSWIERKSYGMSRWRAGPSVHFNGLYIVGDQSSGALYYIDPSAETENGNNHVMEIWCGVSHRFPGDMIVDSLKVDVVGGVGLITGNLADTDPQLLIDYSDDGGKTFEGETEEPLGHIGKYDTTVESFMWGLVREKGRIWRFRVNINAIKGIVQAFLNVRPVRG